MPWWGSDGRAWCHVNCAKPAGVSVQTVPFARDITCAEGAMTKTTPSTHDIVATTCLHLGRPCPAAERMLRALAGALDKARSVTRDDFEITGESRLDGCEKACPARFTARHDRIRVFCDVASATDMAALDRFADTMLSPTALPAAVFCTVRDVTELPRAFGEARPLRRADAPLGQPRGQRGQSCGQTGNQPCESRSTNSQGRAGPVRPRVLS